VRGLTLIEPLSALATAVASKAATTALEPYIRELLDVQESQNQALERLEDNVRAMMDAPWREARIHLVAAESAGSGNPSRRDAELDKAADALIRAYSVHPRPSVARALVAADAATLEGMVGRPVDARSWAARGYDDILAFLAAESDRVKSELNQPPSVLARVRRRTLEDWDFWDRMLGGRYDELRTVAGHKGDEAGRAQERAYEQRRLLELGPDAPPGWYLDEGIPRGGCWTTRLVGQHNRSIWFDERDLPLADALMELHRAASRADDLRTVAVEFGCRDLPVKRLQVLLRSRHNAVVVYGDGPDITEPPPRPWWR
jgi:hypothetical protein